MITKLKFFFTLTNKIKQKKFIKRKKTQRKKQKKKNPIGKTKKNKRKKNKKKSQVFHCVHSDTLYVKNRRNKSEEKKNYYSEKPTR